MGFERPAIVDTAAAKNRYCSTAPLSSAFTDEIALPTLRASSSASSFRFATIASASACSRRERSFAGVLPQSPSSAARAASTARSTSASPASCALPNGSPVAGSTRSRVEEPSTVSPPMKSPNSRPVATAIAADRNEPGFSARADELALGRQLDEVVGLARAVGLALVLGFVVDVLARVVGDVRDPARLDHAET